jgi:D-serine deaminase-like pyridoxal phosphate-dependent protein
MITSPVVAEGKIGRAVKISELDDRLCLVIDNPDNAAAISAAFVAAGRKVAVLVDVDAGMQRTGVADQKAAIDLARRAQDLPGLNYVGLQCYAGHLQHIENPDERQQEALSVMGSLRVLIEELKQCGLAPQIVSGGGTGTFDIDGPAGVLTELQAGSYALMDDQYNRVWTECGQSPPFEVALFVQSSVISNNHAGIATCDAGLKHFGVDGGVPVVARGATDGATYLYAGDEHGRIMLASRDDRLELNSRIEFVVPHCDPTVNLYDHLHCVRGETLVDVWPIGARGA